MVLLIVIAQALPVFLIGVMSKSKEYLWFSAIVMTIVAAFTGSSKYFVVDLLGIGVAVASCYAVIGYGEKRT